LARSSAASRQNPVASPAAYAAPSAVVSATTGRLTGTPFDVEEYLAGRQTPVFFGSALTNFGLEPFLQALIELAGCAEAPHHPAAWLFAVVRRRAMSSARTERRRRQSRNTSTAL
jgi:hypothetical protein